MSLSANSINFSIGDKTGAADGAFSEKHLITTQEAQLFSLGEDNLLDGVDKVVGSRPNQAWLNSPTPEAGRDLYSYYSWQPVLVSTTIKSIVYSDPVLGNITINCATAKNSSSLDADVRLESSVDLASSITDEWTTDNKVEITQEVHYGIDIIGGSTSVSYDHEWGKAQSQEVTTTVGLSEDVKVMLPAGKSAFVEISAQQGTMTATIVYTATIEGGVAANWEKGYDDSHYRLIDVVDLLKAKNLRTTVDITQQVKMVYYSTTSVVVRDA